MVINRFNAGKITKYHPSLIPTDAGEFVMNVDFSKGSLVPLREDKVLQEGPDKKYWTYWSKFNRFVSTDYRASFIPFRNCMYIFPDIERDNSIVIEDLKLKVLSSEDDSDDTDYFGGYVRYIYTFYDGTNHIAVSDIVEKSSLIEGDTIELSLFSEPPEGSYIKLYRQDRTLTSFTLVAELSYTDNLTYIDNNTSDSLSGNETLDLDSILPPIKCMDNKGNLKNVELPRPLLAPKIFNNDINANDPLEYMSGVVTYVYTWYDPETGEESEPSDKCVSDIPDNPNRKISVTRIQKPSNPSHYIRMYRTDALLSNFTLVFEGTAEDYIDNGDDTVFFDDRYRDVDIAGNHILDSYGNIQPSRKLQHVIFSHTLFIGSIDNKLYYSKPAYPKYWPKENYIEFEDVITGIAEVQNGLLVFTKYKTYIVTGTSGSTFSKYLLNGNIGCESHYSIQYINNGVIWLSSSGLVWSNGGNIDLISYPLLGDIYWYPVNDSIALNRQYIIATTGFILLVDFRDNKVAIQNISIKSVKSHWFGKYKGAICFTSVEADDSIIFYKFASDSSTYKNLIFVSNIITMQNYSNRKFFKNIYIKYEPPIHFKAGIDGELVFDRDLEDSKAINFEELSIRDGIDGYGLQYVITGTGKVYEIELKAKPREKP